MAANATKIPYNEAAAPSTPAAGKVVTYAKTDGLMYSKDDAGTETLMSSGGAGSVATDPIWDAAGDLAVGSGANTAAKLTIGAAGGHVARINGVVAWDSGTSNPGAAAAGDRYWRTDLGLEIYYDGTRWVTTEVYVAQGFAHGITTTGTWIGGHGFLVGGRDIWLLTVEGQASVITTNNGTNFWTLEAWKSNAAGTLGGSSSLGSVATSGFTASQAADVSIAINALLDVSATPVVHVLATKTLSPGELRSYLRIRYREIVT